MRITRLICLSVALALAYFLSTSVIRAASSLPNDLLFTVTNNVAGFDANTLVRINAQTLSTSVFYADPAFTIIRAISWSPSGHYLVILRSKSSEGSILSKREYCILNSSAALQICLSDPPVNYGDLYVGDNIVVTWSPDEKHVYYLTGLQSANDRTLQLVEVDTATGQRLRSLYQYTISNAEIESKSNVPAPLINWTTTVDSLTLGTGDPYRIDAGTPVEQIDLQSNRQLSLSQIIGVPNQPNGSPLLLYPGFSPKNNYLLAYSKTDIVPYRQFYILDKKQQVVSSFSLPQVQPVETNYSFLHDPAWLPDETGIYIEGLGIQVQDGKQIYTLHLFRYTLANNQIVEVFQAPYPTDQSPYTNAYNGQTRLKVSPSGTHVASDVTVANPNQDGLHREVAIVSAADGLKRYIGGYASAFYSVWVPPQQ